MNLKKYPSSLIIGISLPIITLLSTFIFIYFSNIHQITPKYSFIFKDNSYSNYSYPDIYSYEVIDGKLQIIKDIKKYEEIRKINTDLPENIEDFIKKENNNFYILNTKKNSSEKISLNDIQKLFLNDSKVSKDGFNLECNYGGNFVLFDIFGFNYNTNSNCFLVNNKNKSSFKIEDSLIKYNTQFIAWIE